LKWVLSQKIGVKNCFQQNSIRSAEVEADSLEEAKEMFVDAEWYEDEPQDLVDIKYYEGTVYNENDPDYIDWEEIDE
jgi:hypothetical protein